MEDTQYGVPKQRVLCGDSLRRENPEVNGVRKG